jgi:hypothetical protein
MKLQDFTFLFVGMPLTAELLDVFEAEVGGVTDTHYRTFLLAKNGGVPSPRLLSSLPELPYPIGVFYSLTSDYSGLRRVYSDLSEVLGEAGEAPLNLLPIAADFGDRNICISLGRTQSPVFIVPQASCADDDRVPNIVKVAECFSTFVNSLSQPEEVESDVEQLAQQSWKEVHKYISTGGDMNAKSPSGLSLLCQSIRYNNNEVFHGLIARGADLTDAVQIAVMNYRLDLLNILVAKGCDPTEGLDSAVGPKRKEIREFLQREIASQRL